MEMKAEWIAPCGINCRTCSAFGRKKNPCAGCRASDENKRKSCSNCQIVNCEKRIAEGWKTCSPCDKHCSRLIALDKRYKEKYHMSVVENLRLIEVKGMESFLILEDERRRCPACGKIYSVHRDKCLFCEKSLWA